MVLPASAGMIPHAIHHTIMCAVVLPASAGMIPTTPSTYATCHCAPRIRGDDPLYLHITYSRVECSPHPRG